MSFATGRLPLLALGTHLTLGLGSMARGPYNISTYAFTCMYVHIYIHTYITYILMHDQYAAYIQIPSSTGVTPARTNKRTHAQKERERERTCT